MQIAKGGMQGLTTTEVTITPSQPSPLEEEGEGGGDFLTKFKGLEH